MAFDFTPLLAAGLPPAAARWTGLAKYNFTGGNNDAEQVPVEGLIAAAAASLKREGRNLATYNLAHGPQGYRPLRDFLAGKDVKDRRITYPPLRFVPLTGTDPAVTHPSVSR